MQQQHRDPNRDNRQVDDNLTDSSQSDDDGLWSGDTTTTSTTDDTSMDSIGVDDHVNTQNLGIAAMDDTTTLSSDEDSADESTRAVGGEAAGVDQNMANAVDDTTATDYTTTSAQDGGDGDDMNSDDTSATMVESNVDPNMQPFCNHGHCRNRSARDCSNEFCGRCCVLHGWHACERHNTS